MRLFCCTLLRISLFVLLSGGLMQAQTWHKLADYPAVNTVKAFSQNAQDVIFALSGDRKVFYTEDEGDHWQAFFSVPAFYNVTGIEAEGSAQRFFALTETQGIAYTDDFGLSWVNDNLITSQVSGQGLPVEDMVISGSDYWLLATNVFVLPFESQLYRSVNGGQAGSWNLVSNLPAPAVRIFIPDGELIYVAASNGQLLRSEDEGQSFVSVSFFQGKDVVSLFAHGQNFYALARQGETAGLYVSDSSGNGWTLLSEMPATANASLAADFDEQNEQLYVNAESGLYRFDFNTLAWEEVLQAFGLGAVLVSANETVFAGGLRINGFFRKMTGESSFTQGEIDLPVESDLLALQDGVFYAADRQHNFLSFRAIDEDQWQSVNLYDYITEQEDVVFSTSMRAAPGKLLLGGKHFLLSIQGVDEITEVGNDFNAPVSPNFGFLFPAFIETDETGDQWLMVQSLSQQHIDYSPDGGMNWTAPLQPVAGMPGKMFLPGENTFCMAGGHFYALVLDFSAGASLKLARSADGSDWDFMALPAGTSLEGKLFTDGAGRLYLFYETSFYRLQTDTGLWVSLDLDLGSDPAIDVDWAFDQQGRMYVLMRPLASFTHPQAGLHIQQPNGTWEHWPFPQEAGQSIFLKDPSVQDGIVFARTTPSSSGYVPMEAGIYYFSDVVLRETVPASLEQKVYIYPNPAVAQTTVEVPYSMTYTLSNTAGCKLASGRLQAGKNELHLPLPAGIYFLTLKDPDSSTTVVRRLMVVNTH